MYSGGIAYQSGSDCLVASVPTSGRGDLWRIRCDGTSAVPIRRTPESEVDPHFSTPGVVYYAKFVNNRYTICCYDVTTQKETVVVDLNDHAVAPTPLPDGSAILFVRNAKGAPASQGEIWESSFPGGILRRLTNNYVTDRVGSCFMDSKRVVVCSGGNRVSIMDLNTLECLFVCEGTLPVLSADERTVFVVRRRTPSYDWDYWSHDLASGVERAFPFGKGLVTAVCALPDGKIAAVFCDTVTDNVGQIAILDSMTGQWSPLCRILDIPVLGLGSTGKGTMNKGQQ